MYIWRCVQAGEKGKGRGKGKGRKQLPPIQGGRDTEAEGTNAQQSESVGPYSEVESTLKEAQQQPTTPKRGKQTQKGRHTEWIWDTLEVTMEVTQKGSKEIHNKGRVVYGFTHEVTQEAGLCCCCNYLVLGVSKQRNHGDRTTHKEMVQGERAHKIDTTTGGGGCGLKTHEIIYNKRLVEYKNNSKREMVWLEIATKVGSDIDVIKMWFEL